LASLGEDVGLEGVHIVVPIDARPLRRGGGVCRSVAEILVKRDPDHLTLEFSKADRGGRILVDTWRNAWGATFAAVYAFGRKPGAPVSAPCTWAELERGTVGPQTFTYAR